MTKGEDTRLAILDRAASLASRIGLEALSIGRLADEMSMSRSGLFAHFGAKEALQLAVLTHAGQSFVELVVLPAFQAPRGEPRLTATFENWLQLVAATQYEGGSLFVQASTEFDDRPGPVQDLVRAQQKRWIASVARSARLARDEGHFCADLDPEQFAFEFHSLLIGYHYLFRLIRDPQAEQRVREAFRRLLEKCHPIDPPSQSS